MNVLSLFDGISCARVALEKVGIVPTNYYASEIEANAIKVSQKNYPDIQRLGDAQDWKSWDLPKIDLFLAGFPCQSFSITGNKKGLSDPRGQLVFTMVDIWESVKAKNPDCIFLLENVPAMKSEIRSFIARKFDMTAIDGEMFPKNCVEIDSAQFSAQQRKRIYWWNGGVVKAPQENCKLVVADILQNDSEIENLESYKIIRDDIFFEDFDKRKIADIGNGGQGMRVYSTNNKAVTLLALAGGMGAKMGIYFANDIVRKLTPIECERLMGLPDDFTAGISKTWRYAVCGNGWQVDTIVKQFFNQMKGTKNDNK